jgi:hypothetical protein
MRHWEDAVGDCFEADCLTFAGSTTARNNAHLLRERVRAEDIPPVVVETTFHDWLHQESSNTGQIHAQMARVREFFDL